MVIFLIILAFGFLGPAPAQAAESHASAREQKAQYYCPMHPQIVSDKPGKCPICFMELVLRRAQGGGPEAGIAGHGVVFADESSRARLGIRHARAEVRELSLDIRLPAVVAHDEALYQAQIGYIESLRSTQNFGREGYRLGGPRRYDISPEQAARLKIMQLGVQEESLSEFRVDSLPDLRLLHLADDGKAWVYATALPLEAAQLKRNDEVSVEVPSMPGYALRGRIRDISPFADMQSRSVRVRILTEEGGTHLRPDEPLIVTVHAKLGEHLSVPEDAVVFTGPRALVFRREGGSYRPKEVRLGAHANGFYQVAEGLAAGDEIAANGTFLIDSESRLSAALASASGAPEGHVHG